MARGFVSASSQFAQVAAARVGAYPLTMVCWYKPTTSAVAMTLMSLGRSTGATPQHYWAIGVTAAAKPFNAARAGGTENDAIHATSVANGVWGHIAGVFTSATSRDIYFNGTGVVNNATSTTPLTLDRTTIGALQNGTTRASFTNGVLAECAIWNVALTAAEITMLAAGVSPLLVRPASLVSYCPLMGEAATEQDWKSATGYAVTGATKAEHPRVFDSRGIIHPSFHPRTPIVPGTINATSTVSGSALKVQRAVLPATVNATSTMSGAIRRAKIFTSGTISATSAVSGDIRRVKFITPNALAPTTPLLDNFNRADGALGANWSTPLQDAVDNALVISGNAVVSTSTIDFRVNSAYWNTSFGADQEVFVTPGFSNPAPAYARLSLYLRLSDPGNGLSNAYRIDINPDGPITSSGFVFNVGVAGDYSYYGGDNFTMYAGDTYCFRAVGTTISFLRLRSAPGSAWETIFSVVDSQVSGGGFIGMATYNDTPTRDIWHIDDFGGGTYVAPQVGISAKSTVSGSLTKTGGGAITPGTISAISAVSGNVVKRAKIAGTISATSVVSGNVAAKKLINPSQISATSTVSGALRVLRAILPGNISATSTVSGSVAKRFRVAGQISATSAVSGSVAKIFRIVAAQISATSTVSGSVVARRAVLPAQINATSTVSGSVAKRFLLIAANISATSTVSGAVRVIRRVIPTTISATSTVSGALRVLRAILPVTISATSTVSGSVAKRFRVVTATINATSTLTGSVVVRRAILPGNISATSTVSGSVAKRFFILPATINATSTMTGSLRVRRAILPGNISATSTVSGNVATRHVFSGTINATSTVTGSVRRLVKIIPATISATSTVSGAIQITHGMIPGQINATSTVTGSLRARRAVSGTIQATSIVTGSLVVRRAVSPAQVNATSTVTGSIVVRRAIRLGTVNATSTVSGNLKMLRGIRGGNINATSTVTGAVLRLVRVAPGTINATSAVSGTVTSVTGLVKPLTVATINATSTVSGAISPIRHLTGTISATSTVSGRVGKLVYILPGNILATSSMGLPYYGVSPYYSTDTHTLLSASDSTATMLGAVDTTNVVDAADDGTLVFSGTDETTILGTDDSVPRLKGAL